MKKQIYLVDTNTLDANSVVLYFENNKHISSRMYESIENGEMSIKKVIISEDFYRFNPGDGYKYIDAHKIADSDSYLLVTSYADQPAVAEITTLDRLLKISEVDLESENERLVEMLQNLAL